MTHDNRLGFNRKYAQKATRARSSWIDDLAHGYVMDPPATPLGMISMGNTQQSCHIGMRKDTGYDSEGAVFFILLWADCYGLFILLIEYLSMDPDSARHASGLGAHTQYIVSLVFNPATTSNFYYYFNQTTMLIASHISHISYA